MRALFWLINREYFTGLPPATLLSAFLHGLRFDLAGLLLLNSVFLVLYMWPRPDLTGHRLSAGLLRLLFLVTNGAFLIVGITDAEYFQFSNRRINFQSMAVLPELLAQGAELLRWYAVDAVGIALMLVLLTLVYNRIERRRPDPATGIVGSILLFLAALILALPGARGGWQNKPLIPANAFALGHPRAAQLILNTPFAVLRTAHQNRIQARRDFTDDRALQQILQPVRLPAASGASLEQPFRPHIFIIILESFASEYLSSSVHPKGFAPFVSGLGKEGVTWPETYANGRRSIDALMSIFGGLPNLMDQAFITSDYQTNRLNGLPALLKQAGYRTDFFHGGREGTMFFDAQAALLGFDRYVGAGSYPDQADDDGHWGIYDEPFLRFVLQQTDEAIRADPAPRLVGVFTLSSHHPYAVPPAYSGRFPRGTLDIHESIGYTDHALRRFFATARTYPWYRNSLFVITADHTSRTEAPEFAGETGGFRVPLIWYWPADPAGLPLNRDPACVAQHVDIAPTLLDLMGLDDQPRPRFGRSLHRQGPCRVVFYNARTWFLLSGDLLQTDGPAGARLYNRRQDPGLDRPLDDHHAPSLARQLRALIQYHHNGLLQNRLNVSPAEARLPPVVRD